VVVERKQPARVMPAAPSPQSNGTTGPQPMPARAPASRPMKIPANIALREIITFATAALKESGEQWSDQSRQDLVSTLFIQAGHQGWIALWERAQ
jgi:hypothetical protein